MSQYYFSTKKLFTALAISLLAIGVEAQNVSLTSSTFPNLPATSCTNTMLDVNVLLGCINAVHTGNSFSVSGTTITVDIDYTLGPICLPAIATVIQSINLGMLPAAAYTVNINGNLNGSAVSTINTTLTVNSCCSAVPSFTITEDTICLGDSIYYSSTSMGATSLQWFENNTAITTNNNFGKRYNTPGSYAIKLKVSNGSCSDSLTRNILVSGPPTINLGVDVVICEGATSPITLDAGSGRDSVRWSDQSTGRRLFVSTAGTYYVKVYQNKCFNSDTIVVSYFSVDPVNLGGDSVLCIGDTLMLDATQAGANYVWQDASTNASLAVFKTGTYHVQVTDNNGCIVRDTINLTFDTCHTSASEHTWIKGVKVYPNPALDFLEVELPQSAQNQIFISLYDLGGKLYLSEIIDDMGETSFKTDLRNIPPGLYILKLSDTRITHTLKIIKH